MDLGNNQASRMIDRFDRSQCMMSKPHVDQIQVLRGTVGKHGSHFSRMQHSQRDIATRADLQQTQIMKLQARVAKLHRMMQPPRLASHRGEGCTTESSGTALFDFHALDRRETSISMPAPAPAEPLGSFVLQVLDCEVVEDDVTSALPRTEATDTRPTHMHNAILDALHAQEKDNKERIPAVND